MNDIEKAVDIDQNAILKHLGLDPRNPAAQALVLTCSRYGLDPILKHAVLIQGRLYVTRDGLLHVAHRSGRLDGIEVLEQGETQSHFIAKVAVYRKDMSRPFAYVGRYPKAGSNKNYGPEMAVKCGEVMALRRAFDVSLAAREELWDQEVTEIAAGSEQSEPQAPPPASPADSADNPARDVAPPEAIPPGEGNVPTDHDERREEILSTFDGAISERLKRGKNAINEGRVFLAARRLGSEAQNFGELRDPEKASLDILEKLIDEFDLRGVPA